MTYGDAYYLWCDIFFIYKAKESISYRTGRYGQYLPYWSVHWYRNIGVLRWFEYRLYQTYLSHIEMNKISLQTNLERNSSNFSYISFLAMNFENLTVEFYVPYVLNMHIKFRSNRILFTIWSINLFFIYNFRLQKLEIITFIWWYSNWSLIFLKFCKH